MSNAVRAAGRTAVQYVRRLTVGRALGSYRRWIGRAVGWWTVAYMIFWLGVFFVAGLESLSPLEPYLPPPGWWVAAAAFVFAAVTLLRGRTPPLVLDRRDLYRLGMTPASPAHVLRWRYRVKQASWAVLALLVGGVWTLLSPYVFGFQSPYAAPALAVCALFLLDLRWLRYAGHPQHGSGASRAAASRAFLVGAAVPMLLLLGSVLYGYYAPGNGSLEVLLSLDPLGALSGGSVLTLVLPGLVLAFTRRAVAASLAEEWPARFPAQSLILTQVQALRALNMLAALAGQAGGRVGDPGERRRLLDSLLDRPGASRPRRSLPMPKVGAPRWRALAWRSASAVYRRPAWSIVLTLLLALSGAFVAVSAGAQRLMAQPGASQGGSPEGSVFTLLAAFIVARVAASLLGPPAEFKAKPLEPLVRSLGRSFPALVVMGVLITLVGLLLLQATNVFGSVPTDAAFGVILHALTVTAITVLALEKYSSWSGAGAGRLEPQIVAALVAALPALVLGGLGVGEWVQTTQLILLGLVAIISV